jgi:hypothetical protein
MAALALAGSASAVSAPAQAQVSGYVGVDGGDAYFGGSYEADPYAAPYYSEPGDPYAYGDQYAYGDSYADPYACDFYNPPWGYPPDYCAYQTWQEPIYYGGLWYSGPIYYRSYGGERLFWLNGGWRHDEWRGARPGRIDWGRNMRWSGPVQHRGGFAGGGNWNGRGGDFRGSRGGGQNFAGQNFRGQNFGGRNYGGQNFGGQNFRGQNFGGQNSAGPRAGNVQGGAVRGRFGGENFQGRVGGGGPGFVQRSNVSPNEGRVFGRGRDGGGAGFVRPNNAGNPAAVRGSFGGRSFQSGGQSGGRSAGQSGPRAGGGERGGHGGEGRGHGR